MRILVTGGAGFVGSHLVPALINEKHSLIVVDNLSSGKACNIPPQAEFYQADIIDTDEIGKIFMREKPEAVFHLAAQTSVPYSIEWPERDAQANVLGTINILNACRRTRVRKYIFMSSAAVYGKLKYLPVDESHQIQPLAGYGLSKYTAEKYAELFSSIHELNFLILRCANIFGERQDNYGEGGVVSIFMDAIINGRPLYIHGDGEQTRDFIYVKDVVAAAINGIDRGDKATVNISTGKGTSINQLVSVMERAFTRTTEVKNIDSRSGDIRDSVLDNQQACRLLGWSPIYNLSQGLSNMSEHVTDQQTLETQ